MAEILNADKYDIGTFQKMIAITLNSTEVIILVKSYSTLYVNNHYLLQPFWD